MTQNIITLAIVFSAFGYTIYEIIGSLRTKKVSKCDGCAGCSLKQHAIQKVSIH